jgi:hypothetical protein
MNIACADPSNERMRWRDIKGLPFTIEVVLHTSLAQLAHAQKVSLGIQAERWNGGL